jgi:hypothetical protein
MLYFSYILIIFGKNLLFFIMCRFFFGIYMTGATLPENIGREINSFHVSGIFESGGMFGGMSDNLREKVSLLTTVEILLSDTYI